MTYTASKSQAGRGSILAIGALSITGDTTSSSDSITSVSSTAGIAVGMAIAGIGIPAGATVTAIGDGTLTISVAATAEGSAVALTVSPAIGEVKDVPMNRGKWKFADVTNYESGSDSESLSLIREVGSIDFDFNRVSSDAGQAAVEAAYQSGARTAFVLMLLPTPTQSTGDSYAFNAYVEGSDFSVDVEKEIEGKVTLRTSGAATLTLGTALG